MAVLRVLLPVVAAFCLFSTTEQTLSVFQTADIIALHGYPSETHHVTTSDGYILEMHRIPHGRGQSPSLDRPVVFLMHGLTAASNCYIMLGPELAPAYNLADSGFDIWMGNARGNRNSRSHVSLNPDDSREKRDFFDFTFEEIAVHDLPAMIDYVLEYTGKEQLHYIGHSQGGTTFLILNSMRPEYNNKIKSAHILAGVGYQEYFPNEGLASLAKLTDTIWNAALLAGFVEVYPPSTDQISAGQRSSHCSGDARTDYMCELVGVRELTSLESRADHFNVFDEYVSAGAALKQIGHYGQNIRDKTFRRWSYGTIQNLFTYGSRNPPEYDLSLITINTTMHYTVNDNLLDERDVLSMAEVMPNTSVRKVARDTFLHEDFVLASDMKELVTDYIVETLRRDSGLPPLKYDGTESNQELNSESNQESNQEQNQESNKEVNQESNHNIGIEVGSTLTSSAHSLVFSVSNVYLVLLSFGFM